MRTFFAILAAAAMFAAYAGEAEVRRMLQEQLRGEAIVSIEKTPWGDLYEVVIQGGDGPQIFYVDGAAQVIIAGQAMDAKSGRNFTEERRRELGKVKWEALPFHWAITSKRGNGRRKIAILSDPNCPYCKRLEEDLAKLSDITVHILPYAVISPKSARQAKSVWCSGDRVKAWNDLMLRGIEPQAAADCDTPIEELVAFGRRLGASSTPTWFLENGERYSGALPLPEVTRLLERASPLKRR